MLWSSGVDRRTSTGSSLYKTIYSSESEEESESDEESECKESEEEHEESSEEEEASSEEESEDEESEESEEDNDGENKKEIIKTKDDKLEGNQHVALQSLSKYLQLICKHVLSSDWNVCLQ